MIFPGGRDCEGDQDSKAGEVQVLRSIAGTDSLDGKASASDGDFAEDSGEGVDEDEAETEEGGAYKPATKDEDQERTGGVSEERKGRYKKDTVQDADQVVGHDSTVQDGDHQGAEYESADGAVFPWQSPKLDRCGHFTTLRKSLKLQGQHSVLLVFQSQKGLQVRSGLAVNCGPSESTRQGLNLRREYVFRIVLSIHAFNSHM